MALHTREGAKRLAGQAWSRLRAAAHWASYLPFVAGRAWAVLVVGAALAGMALGRLPGVAPLRRGWAGLCRGCAPLRPSPRTAALLRSALHGAELAVLALALLGGWLAWRLAQGPLPVPLLAREIERAVNIGPAGGQGGTRLAIGEAAIAWEGFRSGVGAPLDIRLSGIRVVEPNGAVRAELPDAAATLSFGALLRGRVVPATVELRNPSLLLFRAADGRVGLDLGGLRAEGEGGGPTAMAVLAALMQPASERESWTALRRIRLVGGAVTVRDEALGQSWSLLDPRVDIRRQGEGGLVADGSATLRLGALTLPVRLSGQALGGAVGASVRITAGVQLPSLAPAALARAVPALAPLAMLDAPVALAAFADLATDGRPAEFRARLTAGAGTLELGGERRLAIAGLELVAAGNADAVELREARLRLPGEPVAEIALTGHALLGSGAWEVALEARALPLPLAEMGRVWPEWLAPAERAQALPHLLGGTLAEAWARVALRLPESLDRFEWREAEARLALDQPELEFAPGARRRLDAVEVMAQASPGHVRLDRVALHFPALRYAPSLLAAQGEASRTAAGWAFALDATLDQAELAELPERWPEGVGGPERRWLTRNLTAGHASNGRWHLAAQVPADFSDIDLQELSGSIEVSDATVHWLRPVPPLVGASGTVEFAPKEIVVRAQGAHQLLPDGTPGALLAREATIRFWGLDVRPGQMDLTAQLAGPLTEIMAVLQHPRLKLFEKRPLGVQVRGGQAEARLTVAFPLWDELPIEELRLRASGRASEVRIEDLVQDKDLDRGALDLAVDTEGLKLSGEARLSGMPVRLGVEMDFRFGPATQVLERANLTGRLDARDLPAWGLEPDPVLSGPLAMEARWERRRNGQGTVALNADLRQATMVLAPLGWAKPPGTAGSAEAVLRLNGNTLVAAESFRVEALELAMRGRIAFRPDARIERIEFLDTLFGGSRLSGEARPPATAGAPWQVALRGPLLDLRPIFGTGGHVAGGAAPTPGEAPADDRPGPALALDLRFERVTMGLGRDLLGVAGRARTDPQGLLREARLAGTTGPNAPFEATLTPRGDQRVLRLTAADGGALLRALDLLQPVQGGRLTVNATYPELRPGAPLVGTAELDDFVVRDAPAIGKVLQGMTFFGLVDVLFGPGLNFARLVAPFRLTPQALELEEARAFSASLGLTAKGRVLRERPGQPAALELEGTVVPAYVFNALLGNIPVLGRIFSPEEGGGVFAATWRVVGPVEAPQVSVNPLAALTPGFLRGLFGIVEGPPNAAAPARRRR